MRSRLPAVIALAAILAAGPALAGPTCQDRAGVPGPLRHGGGHASGLDGAGPGARGGPALGAEHP